MAYLALKFERLVQTLPGNDEDFSQASIEMDNEADFSKFSTWEIVCEEMLDTQHSRTYFKRAYEELRRREITDDELVEMRRFAWMTVGWLNFKMMMWEWGSLGEKQIYHAIDWQYKDGWISSAEKNRRFEYAKRYDSGVPISRALKLH